MKNIKCLITAGCSFSQVPNTDVTWPVHLNEWLKPEKVYHLGQGAAGNGIISRKVVYTVTEALKTYKPDEILVGIMWSEFDRREIYSNNKLPCYELTHSGIEQYSNPVKVIDEKKYYLINKHWKDKLTTDFMCNAYTVEDSLMITLEHILRVQWLLQLHGIKYFMVEFDYRCLDEYPFQKERLKKDTDLAFLYNQIDKDFWLPINNMYEYAKEHSGFDFARPPDPHPSTEQHKAMVENILVPFLLDKKMVYDIVL